MKFLRMDTNWENAVKSVGMWFMAVKSRETENRRDLKLRFQKSIQAYEHMKLSSYESDPCSIKATIIYSQTGSDSPGFQAEIFDITYHLILDAWDWILDLLHVNQILSHQILSPLSLTDYVPLPYLVCLLSVKNCTESCFSEFWPVLLFSCSCIIPSSVYIEILLYANCFENHWGESSILQGATLILIWKRFVSSIPSVTPSIY